MKKLLLTLTAVITFGFITKAQSLALDTATVSGDTIFCNGGDANKAALAFNPDEQMYYSNNAGGTVQDEYYDINGVYIGATTLTDWRGMWYNSATKAVEGNAWSGNVVIDTLSATGAFTSSTFLFPANMPNVQSAGVFDYDDNVIFYYDSDSLYSISRLDGAVLPTIALTGISNFSNLVLRSLIYTGVAQNEIGLFSNSFRELYLFDKATGALSNTISLPAQSPGVNANWGIAYANDLFWWYSTSLNNWIGYNIFIQCPNNETSINPEICEGETYTSPLGAEYTSTTTFNETFTTNQGCDSVLTINLKVNDCSTKINDLTFENLSIFPNPTSGIINLNVSETLSSIRIMDLTGKTVKVFNAEQTQLDISEFTQGIYFLEISNAERKSVIKIVKK